MEKMNFTSGEAPPTSAQKLADANMLIADFFQATDLDHMCVELWELLKAVTTDKPFSFLGDPSTVFYLEKHLHNIITACRLLLDVAEESGEDLSVDNFHPFSDEQIATDRRYMRELRELNDQYGGLIRRLTLAETKRPILAIKRVFNIYSYDQWQGILEDWVEYGLSKASIYEATGECVEVIQYELLESLLESVYLISRQSEQTFNQKHRLLKAAGSKAVIELLIATLEPEVVFEIIHPAPSPTEQMPYRDLLIVLADNQHKPFRELEPVIELITAGDEKLSCSIRKLSDLRQSLEIGHVYFSQVCTFENIIYQRTDMVLPIAPPEKLSWVIYESKREFYSGIGKAKGFYNGAKYCKQTYDWALSMFMLQQAAELVFRAIAISLYGKEKRTHSIRSLKTFNRRLAPQLNDVFPDNTPQEEKLLSLLEDAYLAARYASSYQIESSDLDTVFARVTRLLELAETTFEERMGIVSSLKSE